MSGLVIKVSGLNELKSSFQKSPEITSKWLNRAIEASLFEIEKEAVDKNFKFITPRSRRTGYLQRSFKFGRFVGNLFGSIGPTAEYALFVHEGMGRIRRKNRFMPRIAKAAEGRIKHHFEVAGKNIVKEIANG